MIVLRVLTCLTLVSLSGGQTLNLYENVTLSGGWTVYPISFIVVENTSVALLCKRNDTFIPTYNVNFGNVLLKFQNDPLVAIEPGTLKLKIDRFSKKYEGEWQCTATVTTPKVHMLVSGPVRKLELAVAPTISQFTAPNTNLSDSVTITCGSPEAKPDPSYLFIRRQTGELLKNASLTKTVSYTIDKVKETDAGLYECVGENKAGLRSGTVRFTVQTVPHTLILNGQNTYTIDQMDNITFRCESTGIPVPGIRWFHDDQMQKAGEQGSSTLTITSAEKIDTGTYRCEGKNDAGVDMDTVALEVRVPPDAPTNLTANERTNVSITLSWTAGSENFSPINGYEVMYRQTGSSDWMIARNFSDGAATEQLVEGLIPLTDYDFRVRARNVIGEGEFSDIEKLITHPNAPSLGPTELSYSEVKAVSAQLTWKIVNESLLASNEGNITYYEMAYSYNNQEKSQDTDGVATSGTLTSLLKGADYKVVVYARNSGPYRSPPSNEVSFTTDTTVPGMVTSLGTTEETENSLNVKWEEPTDTGGQNVRVDGYKVEYRAGASGDFTTFQENQQEKTALIERLIPRREYTVKVTARNVNGFGLPDEIKRRTQTEAVIVTIGTTTETTIKVDWQIGNVPDAVTKITVHWGTDLSETLEKGIETYTIKQLNPETSYTIRVVVSLLNGEEREAIEEVETKALTAIVLRPPETETLHVDKDAPGTATCVTSSGAPPPPPVEWRVNNEVVSSTGFITVQDNVLTVRYAEELNKAIIVCKVNELTSNEVTVDITIESKSSGLSSGAKAGIAIGVILGVIILVIIIIIVVVVMRRKQSGGKFTPNKPDAENGSNNQGGSAACELKEDSRYAPCDPMAPESPEKVPPGGSATSPANDETENRNEYEKPPLSNEGDDDEMDGSNSKQTTV